MPSKFVTIVGIMTYEEAPVIPPTQPPGIWNPVFPTNPIPIYPGGSPNPPGTGGGSPPGIWNPVFPTNPIPIYPGGSPNPPVVGGGNPPGIWGPTDPRPTNPIVIYPGGTPNPPIPPNITPQPGVPGQLPGSDPSGSGWVFGYVPGYGWMWSFVPPESTTEPPAVP